jgi:hypothetical protein
MTRPAAATQSSFPNWVALASLGLALWLFFGNAVPAMRERTELKSLAEELASLRRQYDTWITEARLGRGANAQSDLQSLLLAIDQQGFTPAELCAAYPLQKDPPLLVERATDFAPGEAPGEPDDEPPASSPAPEPVTAPAAGAGKKPQ